MRFLYAKGAASPLRKNGNLLLPTAPCPLTESGGSAVATFEKHGYAGRALMDYCDERGGGPFCPRGQRGARPAATFVVSLVRAAPLAMGGIK